MSEEVTLVLRFEDGVEPMGSIEAALACEVVFQMYGNYADELNEQISELEEERDQLNAELNKLTADKIDVDFRADMVAQLNDELEKENSELKAELEKYKSASIYLHGLLDNIDTASDMFKPDTGTGYFRYVDRKCRERHNVFQADGYDLFDPVSGEKIAELPPDHTESGAMEGK